MAVDYIQVNFDKEDSCWTYVTELVETLFKNQVKLPEIIPMNLNDPGASKETMEALFFWQKQGVDFALDFGQKVFMVADYKGTKGIQRNDGWFPGYITLTMELFTKKTWDSEPKTAREYYNYKSYVFPSKGFTKANQQIFYISELMCIVIPKHRLIDTLAKHSYKVDPVFNEPWILNYSDKSREKQVKNIYFNLNNDKDIRLLLEAGACFYRRINGKYTSYDPVKIKSYQIEQEYFRNKDK